MKKIALLTLAAAALLSLSACGAASAQSASSESQSFAESSVSAQPTAAVQKLTASEAHDRMQSGDPLILLDVRTAEEYAEAHIPGAVLLPNEEIGDTRPAQLPTLDAEILVYCRSGNRSAQAASKLAALGYTNVYDFGGIRDWPFETESGAWVETESTAGADSKKSGTLASFSTYDLDGGQRDESIFAGHKLTMMNVWATFCGPCLSEMPELGQLAASYEEQGVQIVGIVVDVPSSDGSYDASQIEYAQDIVSQTGASYLHLLPSPDLDSALLNSVQAVPTTVFVDENGNLVGESYLGARSKEGWSKVIDELLAQVNAQ